MKELEKISHGTVIKKNGTHIMFLDYDDPKREEEFEIEFQLSLTPTQRYEAMARLVEDGLEMMRQNGYDPKPGIFFRDEKNNPVERYHGHR